MLFARVALEAPAGNTGIVGVAKPQIQPQGMEATEKKKPPLQSRPSFRHPAPSTTGGKAALPPPQPASRSTTSHSKQPAG